MILRLTTHPVLDVPANFPLTISSGATILNLKQQLEREWDGNPSPDGIVCVKGGRVCRDGEVLIDVFPPGVSTWYQSELWRSGGQSRYSGRTRIVLRRVGAQRGVCEQREKTQGQSSGWYRPLITGPVLFCIGLVL